MCPFPAILSHKSDTRSSVATSVVGMVVVDASIAIHVAKGEPLTMRSLHEDTNLEPRTLLEMATGQIYLHASPHQSANGLRGILV
jgi:hypothetical protein